MSKSINYSELFEDLVNIIEKSLQIVGLSDIYRRKSERSKAFILTQRVIYAFGTLQLPFLMLGEVILIYKIVNGGKITNENFLKIAEVSPCVIMCAHGLMKSSRLVLKRWQVIGIIEELREMWPGNGDVDEETKEIVDSFMLPNKRIAIGYSLCSHILSAVYNLCPVGIMIYNVCQNGHTDFFLPYLVWYPYDNSKHFFIWLSSYTSQIYAGVYVTGSVAAADCLFGLMVYHLSMHIELLGKKIREIPKYDASATSVEKLNNSIILHNKLIRICKSIEEIFSPLMLFNLVSSSVLICILIFSVTIAPPGLIAKYGVFTAFSMTNIYVMSYYGNKVIANSAKIGFAIYSCPWTDLSGPEALQVKKSLVLMIARAQKPLKISAYGFTDVSMKTFAAVLRASWSYFTLLRVMYQKAR